MRVTLIYNPKAGDGGPDRDSLLGWMRDAGHDVEFHSSKADDWTDALKDPGDLVAVSGGDGTLGKVARQLAGGAVPIAILPTGTANNIARTFGLSDVPLAELIGGWESAARTWFDVARVRGPWGESAMLESAGIGLIAEVIAELRGTGRFDGLDDDEELAAIREVLLNRLRQRPARRVSITLDGEKLSGDYILVEAMNTKFVGPNLHLAPEADPGDGLLDIVLATDAERELLYQHLAGDPDEAPPLPVRRGKWLHTELAGETFHSDSRTWPEGHPAAGVVIVEASYEHLELLVPPSR